MLFFPKNRKKIKKNPKMYTFLEFSKSHQIGDFTALFCPFILIYAEKNVNTNFLKMYTLMETATDHVI